jgi:hypothetical protein
MSGVAHLRIVVAVFTVGGVLALLLYASSLFLSDMGVFPFLWANGLASIGLAIWLYRGSNVARILLIVLSVIGILLWGAFFIGSVRHSLAVATVPGIAAILSVYCLWALMFSKEVRAEIDRRAAE